MTERLLLGRSRGRVVESVQIQENVVKVSFVL